MEPVAGLDKAQKIKLTRMRSTWVLAMKTLQLALAASLLAVSFSAAAQWVWLEKDGRKVYSDRAPGVEIPEKNILKRPGGTPSKPVVSAAEGTASEPASAASKAVASGANASAPKLSGKDKELEDKKKQAEAAEKAKVKEAEEKNAKAKSENCERAKKNLTTYKSGIRLKQSNAKGEAEYITDEARAAETARLESLIAGC
jgi:Domain of unknown function (DUF4124)